MIWLPLLGAALAEPVRVVVPTTGAPDDRAVARTLEAAGLGPAEAVDAERFVRGVEEVELLEGLGPDCEANPIAIDDWRVRLTRASGQVTGGAEEAGLAQLVGVELEIECLAEPIDADDLFLVDVGRADALLELARRAALSDPSRAVFYAQEAAAALDRAAVVGGDVPPSSDPGLGEALDSARDRARATALPWIVPLGAVAGSEVRVNGQKLGPEGLPAVVGDNLVQRVERGGVVAARRVPLRAGELALLDLDGGHPGPAESLVALTRGAPTDATAEVLIAMAAHQPGDRVIYLGWARGAPAVYRSEPDRLVQLSLPKKAKPTPPPPPRETYLEPDLAPNLSPDREAEPETEPDEVASRPREREVREREVREREVREREVPKPRAAPRESVGRWVASAGVGFGAGWEDGAEALVLASLFGRVRLASEWALAFSVRPVAPSASLDPAGLGVEAWVPVVAGVRWGLGDRRVRPELGLDVGARFGSEPVRPEVDLCGGVTGATGVATAIRVEACATTDASVFGVHFGFGVESRI